MEKKKFKKKGKTKRKGEKRINRKGEKIKKKKKKKVKEKITCMIVWSYQNSNFLLYKIKHTHIRTRRRDKFFCVVNIKKFYPHLYMNVHGNI